MHTPVDLLYERQLRPTELPDSADVPCFLGKREASFEYDDVLRPANLHRRTHDGGFVFIGVVKIPHSAHTARRESDICQDVVDRVLIPFSCSVSMLDTLLIQLVCDIKDTLSTQEHLVDASNYLGLLWHDHQVVLDEAISIRRFRWDEDSLLHPDAVADPHICRVSRRLDLSERAVDVRHLLRVHLAGVKVLFLKADCDAEPEKFAHIIDVILLISGEARY